MNLWGFCVLWAYTWHQCDAFLGFSQYHAETEQRTKTFYNSVSNPTFVDNKADDSIEALLLDRLECNDTSSINVSGYVLSKRSLGKSLIFVDFNIPGFHDDCQAMLRSEYLVQQDFKTAKNLLLKGTKLNITGRAGPTRNPGNVVLLIESLHFDSFPRQLQYIQMLLRQYLHGSLNEKLLMKAIPTLETQKNIRNLPSDVDVSRQSMNNLKEVAKQILKELPKDANYPKAVDQVQFSKQGNFAIPQAPMEWRNLPASCTNNHQATHAFDNIVDVLKVPNSTMVSISGWVQNRRRFQQSITSLALVQTLENEKNNKNSRAVDSSSCPRLMAILHPDLLSEPVAAMYQNLAGVSGKIFVKGKVIMSSEPILWITDIHLKRSSTWPATIRYLLDLVTSNKFNADEACDALLISNNAEKKLLNQMNPTARQWKANELSIRLQDAKKTMETNNVMNTLLEKYKSQLEDFPIQETTLQDMEDLLQSSALTKAVPSISNSRMQRAPLPIGMPGSKWQRKKRPQLAWMGQQVHEVLQSHPDFRKRPLQILDIGGGKGSLAHYLGQAFDGKVQIRVIDICEGAISNGATKAARLNLPVDFSLADASNALNVTADIVVALHACGHLSDIALAHALQRRAGFVIVPCCFNSNPHLTIPDASSNTVGSGISVSEWLQIPPNDWSSLKLLAETQGDVTLANQAIATMCAIRANRARNDNVSIRRFPIEFSTRNTVLVGLCS